MRKTAKKIVTKIREIFIQEVIFLKIGYVRVSTIEQHEDRQIAALNKWGAEKIFIDKLSGKNMERQGLKNMLEFVREGDTLCVLELSRLGRSVPDLIKITNELKKKNVNFVSLKENCDISTPIGQFFFTIIASIAQLERETLLERQREGIEQAKLKHVYKGRQPRKLPDDFDQYYQLWLSRRMSRSQIARELKISRPVLLKLMRQYEEKLKAEPVTASTETGLSEPSQAEQ